jgi:hypothetical protein
LSSTNIVLPRNNIGLSSINIALSSINIALSLSNLFQDKDNLFRLQSGCLDGKTAGFAAKTGICRAQTLFPGADQPAAPLIRVSPSRRKPPATRRRRSFYQSTL